jgi:uncharacterized protein (DUF1330 family)
LNRQKVDQTTADPSSEVGKTFKDHPVKILAAYGPQQVLEGEAPEGVVIVEFPSTAAARAGYSRSRFPGSPGIGDASCSASRRN